MSDTKQKFDDLLKKFITSSKNTQALAVQCSMMALEHFKEHGDLAYCQRFYDAIPKNYGRPQAFAQWLMDFAPVVWDASEKAFKKDKSEDAMKIEEINVEAAGKKPYFEYVPDRGAIEFERGDVITQLKRVIGRFRNPKRYSAHSEEDRLFLDTVQERIDALETIQVTVPSVAGDNTVPAAGTA